MAQPKLKWTTKLANQCRFTSPLELRWEIENEEYLFKAIVAAIVTTEEEALQYNPQREWEGLWRSEGGLTFFQHESNKATHVAFQNNGAVPKITIAPMKEQNLIYNVLTSNAINRLCELYSSATGDSVCERLKSAGWQILSSRMTRDEFENEIKDCWRISGNSWDGFFHPFGRYPIAAVTVESDYQE